jgi:hypothetical protein
MEIVPRLDCVTLRLQGELDMQTAPHLREAALCGPEAVFDSASPRHGGRGLHGLDRCGGPRRNPPSRQPRGGRLMVVNPSRQVLRVLEVTGIDGRFEVEHSPRLVDVT